MAKHTTHKTSDKGKAATLYKRQARAAKMSPEARLTRSGHVKSAKS